LIYILGINIASAPVVLCENESILTFCFKDFIKLKRVCSMLIKSFALPWLIVCKKRENKCILIQKKIRLFTRKD